MQKYTCSSCGRTYYTEIVRQLCCRDALVGAKRDPEDQPPPIRRRGRSPRDSGVFRIEIPKK